MATPPLPTKVESWQASDGASYSTQLEAYAHSAALLLGEAVTPDGFRAVAVLEVLLLEQTDFLWDVVNAVKHMASGRNPDQARIP